MKCNVTAARLTRAIDASVKRLAKAVDRQRASHQVRRHFDLMARFPRHSWRNCWLIAAQRPSATLVAGFQHWRRLGRHVRRGERSIRIVAPCPARTEDGEDEKSIVYFKTACVFDVSQTDGKALPVCTLPVVEGDATALLMCFEKAAAARNITVRYVTLPDGVFGVSEGGSIRIAANHSTAQQAKSMAHEMAHELLHQRNDGQVEPGMRRETKELEAEAVAYVVCRHFGLDVEVRASRYIALWEGDAKALAASFTRISRTARQLIEAVTTPEEGREKVAA